MGDASLLGGRCDTACLVEPDVTRTLISSRSDAVCLCCRYSSVCPSAGAASGRYRKILHFVRRRIKYQGSVMYEPYFPAASIRLTVLVCHVRIVKFTRIASPKLPVLSPLLRSRSRFSGGSNYGIGTRSFFQLSPWSFRSQRRGESRELVRCLFWYHWTHLFRGYQTGLTSFRLDEGLRLLE